MLKSTVSLCIIFVINSYCNVFAQKLSIGFHGTATEYIGDLSNNNYSLYKFRFFKPGGGISSQQYLNSSLNLVEMLSYNKLQYQGDTRVTGVDANFLVFNLMLKYKFNNGYLLQEDAVISPYVVTGLGETIINSRQLQNGVTGGKISVNASKGSFAVGAGLFLRLSDVVGIDAAGIFQRPFYDAWDGVKRGGTDIYLQHSIGLTFSLKKAIDSDKDGVVDKKDKCLHTAPGVKVDSKGCPIDSDGDGVADDIDRCPQEPGLAEFGGCPDTDHDGVEDSKDQCSNTPAGVKVDALGCPLDLDHDGVPDYRDKCSATKIGVQVDENGCAIDNDNDGVLNNDDKCPETVGTSSNFGCPEISDDIRRRLNLAASGVSFVSAKATIKPESFQRLDEIVAIIKQYADYNVSIGGFSEVGGSALNNIILSQERVEEVKKYFISKGISENRILIKETRPVISDKNTAAIYLSRRIEIGLQLK